MEIKHHFFFFLKQTNVLILIFWKLFLENPSVALTKRCEQQKQIRLENSRVDVFENYYYY